ncbi:MAG: hypothetical protein QM820_64365 [Minicystis sp.]
MSPEGGDAKGAARSAVLLGVSVIVLASPIRLLWAREGAPWYAIFAIWLGLVAIAAIAARRPPSSER